MQVLLKSADLSLVFGRRYGMVGRNGLGKSTLLKMISSGQLIIQSHVSVLHVEQGSRRSNCPSHETKYTADRL